MIGTLSLFFWWWLINRHRWVGIDLRPKVWGAILWFFRTTFIRSLLLSFLASIILAKCCCLRRLFSFRRQIRWKSWSQLFWCIDGRVRWWWSSFWACISGHLEIILWGWSKGCWIYRKWSFFKWGSWWFYGRYAFLGPRSM